MHLRNGEKLIDKLDSIEDTKGNNGDRGIVFKMRYRLFSKSNTHIYIYHAAPI